MNLGGWNRAEGAGLSICNHVIGTRDIDNITGKLGDVGKVAILSGGPRQRGTENRRTRGCQEMMLDSVTRL